MKEKAGGRADAQAAGESGADGGEATGAAEHAAAPENTTPDTTKDDDAEALKKPAKAVAASVGQPAVREPPAELMFPNLLELTNVAGVAKPLDCNGVNSEHSPHPH